MPTHPTFQELFNLLESKYLEYNQHSFIENDPICIPHSFSKKQDIEIAGFFAASFAWGQRSTIINKSRELMQLMDLAPHDYVLNHQHSDLEKLSHFKHRTFNFEDLKHFLRFLKSHYQKSISLETAFNGNAAKERLSHFHETFFSFENNSERTRKHVATPARKSTCKRLNMYLRWMVRQDGAGVDFGLWKNIPSSQLMIPYDVHVERVARKLGLISRKQNDWQAVEELTNTLKKFDAEDPVKYDFALFGMGVLQDY